MDSDQTARYMELEDKLSKIRSQINSKLDNQKHIAIILSAVEENIQNVELNDTAKNVVNYMVSLLSLLDQTTDGSATRIKDLQLATSAAYLLDLVFHYSPKQLLVSKYAELLTKISLFITDENAQAPLVKSSLGCLEALLIAQDAQSWNNTNGLSITPVRGLQGLLELSFDPRPKVRKRAQEAVSNILLNPPPAPTAEHVASGFISQFAIDAFSSTLEEFNALNKSRKKKNSNNKNLSPEEEAVDRKFIHTLQLINSIIATNQWPSSKIEPLCDLLLETTKSSNEFLISNSFKCFENLFNSMTEFSVNSGLADDKFVKLLDIIFELKPSNNDTHLTGSWIAVVVKAMISYSNFQPLKTLIKIPDIFKLMSNYLLSNNPEIFISASQCLIAILSQSVKDDLLLIQPTNENKVIDAVDMIISDISDIFVDFLSVKYIHCAKEILNVLAAAFNKFKYRANPHFLKPLEIVDSWRVNEENFLDFRNETEIVIGSAVSAIGPDTVLNYLPLNLDNPSNSQPGRAWLLPILRDYTKNAELRTFINKLAPLVQYFESKYSKLPKESVQLKVFETVVDQIWSTLPHFCELPIDLEESFTDDFASELCSLLYSKIELRTTICHALRVLVESNKMYVGGALADDVLLQQRLPVSKAESNLKFLATKAPNLLAVLFNVYTQTAPNARNYILETIESFLQISEPEDLEKIFNNVCGLLKNAMNEEASKSKDKPQLTATLLDIIVCMTKYVPASSYSALFSIFDATVRSSDALTQKRAYRIITRLSETDAAAVTNYINEIENVMLDNAKTVHTSSKSARLAAIRTLIDLLPSDHLGFVVKIVAEVILCTKDVNEKSREGAFETLIAMCTKMNDPNGIIKLSQIEGYDPAAPDQQSSVSEFFKIISAGLIGESQHMVSSTVTAYACLVYEFKDSVDQGTLMEIYDTIELYLTSNSREIVKSAIGFTKVCILGLPTELMQDKIPALLPKLLRWSHEHTGHFKSKIKNIIERLIRKFGYEFIETHFPPEDSKLLANIRKTRNRNKRKDEEGAEGQSEISNTNNTKGSRFLSAFDEAVYESSDNEEEEEQQQGRRNRKSAKQFIMESKGNPLDLLDSQTLAHISSTRPKKFDKDSRKKALRDDTFSFDDEGKLVVKGKKSANDDDDIIKSVTSGINAYLEAVEHGPIRGQRNKLKFKKGSKAQNDSDDEDAVSSGFKKRVDTRNKIGKNYKKNNGRFKNKRKF